ncbi:hypothetical protein SAMN05444748_10455 [Variovorax sp. OV700]|nr:hypothetical protein SAMN05444748_10455 [Variovorax sp. OV700]
MTADDLKQLAEAGNRRGNPVCGSWPHRAAAWESFTEDRWPTDLMQPLGTLRADGVDEPVFEEFHPHGTRYDSVGAPISVAHFPFNRCDVYRCTACARLVLRYTEFGGYYVDHRARRVDAALVSG